jgi:hypothetical protein
MVKIKIRQHYKGVFSKKKNAGDKAKHTYIAGSKDLFTWNLLVL